MNKKKIFFSVLLVLLIGFVLFVYNAFNGNPISKFISKQVLEDYLEETYPDQEFRIKEGFYNFKFSEYNYTVIEIGNTNKDGNVKEYQFRINGFFTPEVRWDGLYYANLDEQLANQLSQQAENEILPLLEEQIENIHHFEIRMEVLKGTFEEDVKWSKHIALEKPMELFVQLDSTDQTKEDFYSTAKNVKQLLDQHDYDYESILFNASGFDMEGVKAQTHGYLKFSLKVEKDETVDMGNIEEHNQDAW
ncbi:hypothetical protein ACFO3D_17800 [Virgibacillus kekensis]|uniref:Uncharacterized protein n=1 Tax=Virgibacillus kekensis TaxID=202261 RepID=A0ABV9DNT6_9BACI